MSQTITPTPQYANATALVRTVDGELWSDTGGPAPYGPLLQTVADRLQYARGALWGQLVWSGRMSVNGTSNTVFAVTVGAIEACAVCYGGNGTSTGTWLPHFKAETTLGLADVEGSPANLTANQTYYVYARSDGTNLVLFINTTPPDSSGIWQSAGGNPTRRYLGCFFTNASGTPLGMSKRGNVYTFDHDEIGSTDVTRVLNGGTATASTSVSCAAVVPPHVTSARLRTVFAPNAAGDYFSLLRTGATASNKTSFAHSTQLHAQEIETLLDASQRFDYLVSTASAALTVRVLGFVE